MTGGVRTSRSTLLLAGAALVLAAVVVTVIALRSRLYAPSLSAVSSSVVGVSTLTETSRPTPGLTPYEGLGSWLDAFDFAPSYGIDGVAAIDPTTAISQMGEIGVRTVYVQAARFQSRTPGLIEDPWVLAELLLAAHQNGMQVVAWYLPKLEVDGEDRERVAAMVDFEVLGHRFDGIALDIEADPEPTSDELRARNAALLDISQFTRSVTDLPVGAIVLPPPLIEDVNEQFWPEFPWAAIGPYYDVWLPMSYWSGRSDASGFGDGYNYNAESTRRIRDRIGDPDAPVHGIGGIGGVAGERDFTAPEILASIDDFPLFARSLADTGSIGGSIYDWLTLDPTARTLLGELFATGPAAALPPAPAWPAP